MSEKNVRERMKANIRKIITIGEWMNQREIEEHLGASANSTRNYLRALAECNLVDTHTPDPTKPANHKNVRKYRGKPLETTEEEMFEKVFVVIARINQEYYAKKNQTIEEKFTPSPHGVIYKADDRGLKLIQTEKLTREEKKKRPSRFGNSFGVTNYANMFLGG